MPTGPERHIVQFYKDDHDLAERVPPYLLAGLRTEGTVIVVATATHRAAFEAALAAAGVDVQAAVAAGRYVRLDAGDCLATLEVDGQLDPGRFAQRVGSLIAEASATDHPIRVYGEMVAILWERGDLFGALRLEALWNDLQAHHPFELYCAYPVTSIPGTENLAAAKGVCDHHSGLVTPTDWPLLRGLPASPGGEAESSNFFAPVPLASKAVRRFVLDTLTSWHRYDLVENAALVVSELASNALVHADSPFRVSLRQRDWVVRLTVHDASDTLPTRRRRRADQPGGRGIEIVSALSRAWGCDPVVDGKVVWADLHSKSGGAGDASAAGFSAPV